MNKGVKKVRKSIVQRKKMRGLNAKDGSKKQIFPAFPEEEEKHGYFPIFTDSSMQGRDKSNIVPGFMLKGILAASLFLGAALLTEAEAEFLQKPKEWTGNVLTEEFPFAKVNLWYQETFGSPLAFTPQQNETIADGEAMLLPVNGNVTETFQANGKGILIAPEETADVSALRDGVIIFAGNDSETNKTVEVQHADGSISTYGYLSDVDVHLYQFVSGNQRIGKFTPTAENETVYFSIEKDNDYFDPVQVIQVDDLP
ncbi:stage IV sporulation protein FA [Virgibacillus profundi]|uniref:Stage IV sporulation protein FA n=1 Tax=Virgibacillus profundi TaxID=2024555 RepID=A0A2A2I910_9BACI|nr:M23 family metallopeptidase [Virgibacillus profundi]PAV27615.1 stage IV sporulation protein FA [Virgibacillus profundi]PXY51793.1 M23 family peptidase [Virgibacillus profundi]